MSEICAAAGCVRPPEPRDAFCAPCQLAGKARLLDQSGRTLCLARAIQTRREDLELKQSEIAEALGVDTSIVSLWERGRREVPAGRLDALAEALKVTVEWLVDHADDALPKRKQQVPEPVEIEEVRPRRPGLERLEAYSLHPFFGRSPAPGRPRPAA